MKICPQCSSARVRTSHARTSFEKFLKNSLGFCFFRCPQCDWRGKQHSERKLNKYSGKKSIWVVFGVYALAILLVLFIVFVVIGVGDAPPAPPTAQ
jgi:hypothetical protein